MEERLKLLEGKIDMLFNALVKIDQMTGVLFQWALTNKQFMDTLKVTPKIEEKPAEPAVDTSVKA